MRKIILKLGGSIITKKESYPPKVNTKTLKRLAQEIQQAWDPKQDQLIVVHGAGCFGHIPADQYGLINEKYHEKKAIGAQIIYQGMKKLHGAVAKAFWKYDLPFVSFPPHACCSMNNKKLIEMSSSSIIKMTEYGMIPVLYGDAVLDQTTGIDIVSGDQIVCYLASVWKPNLVALGTDVDGVFESDPKIQKNAKLIPEISSDNWEKVFPQLSGSTHIDVTGGMAGKIQHLWKLAKEGTESCIYNANKHTLLTKILQNEKICATWIYE